MFTLIVPTYNSELYFNNLKNDLLSQTYKDFKCIFIDDCSTDNTIKLINDLISIDNRFTVLSSSKNTGSPSYARNLGIKLADTEWIIFIDDDDRFDCSLLQDAYNIITSNPNISGLSQSDGYHKTIHGHFYRKSIIDKYNIMFPTADDYSSMITSEVYPSRYAILEDLYFTQIYYSFAGYSEEIKNHVHHIVNKDSITKLNNSKQIPIYFRPELRKFSDKWIKYQIANYLYKYTDEFKVTKKLKEFL